MKYISIITPFYKGNKYIENLISCIEENEKELKKLDSDLAVELVIVNDSPGYELKLPKSKLEITVITHKKNMGIHKSRVDGLKIAKGEFIKFLDQDDYIYPCCLKEELEKMEKNDMVISNALLQKADGKLVLLYEKDSKKLLNIDSYLCSHNQIVSPGQCLIKKASIPKEWSKYILKVNGSDDLFLWILMFCKKESFTYISSALYLHNYTGDNVSQKDSAMSISSLAFSDYLKDIEYVPKKYIDLLVSARKLDIALEKETGLKKKIGLYLKNLDILFKRIYWKLRG